MLPADEEGHKAVLNLSVTRMHRLSSLVLPHCIIACEDVKLEVKKIASVESWKKQINSVFTRR